MTTKNEKQGRMDTLRPKILAMEKAGKSLTQIAKELKLSNSYVWVIARKYVFDPEKAKKRTRKTNGKKPAGKKAAKLTRKSKAAKPAPAASNPAEKAAAL